MKVKRKVVYCALAVIALVAMILVCVNFVPILEYVAEKYLVVRDSPEKSDVIIIISGGFHGERLERGIELFKKGYGKKMIFSGSLITKDISTVDLWLERAERLGISSEDVFLHRNSTSSRENAVYSAKIMEQHKYKSAILVTSPYHSRRAKRIFKKVFDKKGCDLAVMPVQREKKLCDEHEDRRTDIVIEEIIFELQKTVYYWIAY